MMLYWRVRKVISVRWTADLQQQADCCRKAVGADWRMVNKSRGTGEGWQVTAECRTETERLISDTDWAEGADTWHWIAQAGSQ